MKKYLSVLCLLLAGVVALMLGLMMVEQDSHSSARGEAWCEAMVLKSNSEWTDEETRAFAENCLYE